VPEQGGNKMLKPRSKTAEKCRILRDSLSGLHSICSYYAARRGGKSPAKNAKTIVLWKPTHYCILL